jgi:hypothetical protein
MRPGIAFVVSCAFAVLTGVAQADDTVPFAPDNGLPMVHYREEAPRPGYHVVRSRMTGFFVVSTFLFATGYLASFGIAASARFEDGSAWLAVPVVGPFVGVANARSCAYFAPQHTVWDCTTSELGALVGLGIMQTVGAILFPFGFLHRRYWQRNTLVPTVSMQGGLRVGVVGTF